MSKFLYCLFQNHAFEFLSRTFKIDVGVGSFGSNYFRSFSTSGEYVKIFIPYNKRFNQKHKRNWGETASPIIFALSLRFGRGRCIMRSEF